MKRLQRHVMSECHKESVYILNHRKHQNLLATIREAKWFSIIADETRDVSNQEQLVVTVRWVDDTYDVHEDVIAIVNVVSTTADSITITIYKVLESCNLLLCNCRGQAYDVASNMMGCLRGVTEQLEALQPLAVKVHCLAHCLNLCLQDTTRKCQLLRDALDMIMEVYKLFLNSPRCFHVFQQCKQDLATGGVGLRPLCLTRWTIQTGVLDAVLKNYAVLLQTVSQISQKATDDIGKRANGMLSLVEKFDTYFRLKLSHLLFSATEKASTTLQRNDLLVQEVSTCSQCTINYLRRLRNDENFDQFYATAIKSTDEQTGVPP